MAKKLVQRLRKIVNFHVDVPRELQRQLRELENGFYGALDTLAGNLGDYLGISGLDGVKVVPGGGGVLVARRSRESITVTAGGTITGSTRKDVVRFESLSAHVTAYGIVEPGADDTHRLLLINATDYTVTLAHNSTASAARRFLCPHSVDYELRPNECIEVEYQEVATEQRWRVLGDSKPLHIVRSLEDLPTPVAGVITLPDGSGIWRFIHSGFIDGGTNQLVVGANVTLWSDLSTGWTSEPGGGAPALVCNSVDCRLPFLVQHTSFDTALRINPAGAFTYFRDWQVIGDIDNYAAVDWFGGTFTTMTILLSGGLQRIRGLVNFKQIVVLSGRVDFLDVKDCTRITSFPSDPIVLIPNGNAVNDRLTLINCDIIDGPLITWGNGINGSGATPAFLLKGNTSASPASNTITSSATPAGGLTVEDCVLHATNPFSGFSAVTTKVTARNNRDPNGNLLEETPNGRNAKNSSGLPVTKRHYWLPTGGIEIGDDGTNNTIDGSGIVGTGAANTLFQMNGAGTATEWQLLFDNNVATNADIDEDKLDKSAADRSVLVSNGTTNSWTPDVSVDTLTAHENIALRLDADPGDPTDGVTLFYDNTDAKLIARFDNSYRHDVAPDDPFVSGQVARHFHEIYKVDRDGATGVYTMLSEGYSSPFGLTHGTSSMVVADGFAKFTCIADDTDGGTRLLKWFARWLNSGDLQVTCSPDVSAGDEWPAFEPAFEASVNEGGSNTLEFDVTPATLDASFRLVIWGDVWVAPIREVTP